MIANTTFVEHTNRNQGRVRCQPGTTNPVVRVRCNHPRHMGAMTVRIRQRRRPVNRVEPVDDPPDKIGMAGINTRVDDRDPHPRTPRHLPRLRSANTSQPPLLGQPRIRRVRKRDKFR